MADNETGGGQADGGTILGGDSGSGGEPGGTSGGEGQGQQNGQQAGQAGSEGNASGEGQQQDGGQQDQQGDAGKAGDAGDQGESQVPEKYELKLPDGASVDDSILEKTAGVAKEMGLSQENAQKLVEIQNEAVSSYAQAQQQAFEAERGKWVDQVKADKEIGGSSFDASVGNARKAIEQFATPEFKAALDSTGFGNHPELVRVFARIGKAMGEDSFVQSGKSQGESKSLADRLYGG